MGIAVTALVTTLAGSACGIKQVGDTDALLTDAEQRIVVARPFSRIDHGRVVPKELLCAEPSPDVAKVFSKSFNFSGALSAVAKAQEAPVQGAVNTSGAASAATAQALAQLTNRLATIQLLRDGLYRACEAYANGALSEVTYAVILSGYADTMVTLMSGELAAGNFGQSLAVIGTSASGTAASAANQASQDQAKAQASQEQLKTVRADVEKKRQDRDAARTALTGCAPDDQACKTKATDDLRTKEADLRAAESSEFDALVQTMGAVSAAASSNASATIAQAVGAVPASNRPDVGKILEEMQKLFLTKPNTDALSVACLTVMNVPVKGESPPLVEFCQKQLPLVLKAQADLGRLAQMKDQPAAALVETCLAAVQDGPTAATAGLVDLCRANLGSIIEAQTKLQLFDAEERVLKARLELTRSHGQPTPGDSPARTRNDATVKASNRGDPASGPSLDGSTGTDEKTPTAVKEKKP